MTASVRRTPVAHRARLRRRFAAGPAAAAAAAVLLLTSSSAPATAGTTGTTGTALAQSAAVTNGSGIALTAVGTGVTGSLAASLLQSVLASGTANLPNALAGIATTGLTTTAGLQAVNAPVQQPRPTPTANYPTCNQSGWVYPSGNCFAIINTAAAPAVAANSLLAVSAGTVQGYATGDKAGFVAASGSTHPIIAIPGLVVDLGVASSNSQCDTTPVCTSGHSFTGGSITTTAGTQTFALAGGGNSLASVGNTPIANATTLPIVGNQITATANGNLLTFNVAVPLTQYLAALGTTLGALGNGLAGKLSDNASTVTLGVTVGPGSITTQNASGANAWGLDVGINLIADIKINQNALGLNGLLGALLGSAELATAGASNYPATAGSSPNLLDLKFAYSTATAGLLLADFVPPGLM